VELAMLAKYDITKTGITVREEEREKMMAIRVASTDNAPFNINFRAVTSKLAGQTKSRRYAGKTSVNSEFHFEQL